MTRQTTLLLSTAVLIVLSAQQTTRAQSAPPYTVLHAFAPYTDGAFPEASLIQALDGNFYGTTLSGGPGSAGTVFRMTQDGAGFKVLRAFGGAADGTNPTASLIQAKDGNLYGTTEAGGANANSVGAIFKMKTDGTSYIVLHSFDGGTDGANPQASLIQALDGNFYGTTLKGGTRGFGTVFTMAPDGTGFTVLHAFAGGMDDGAGPSASLIQAADGNFYGTTLGGGARGFGTVFTITQDGIGFNVLHSFNGVTDGSSPQASLIQAADSNFYGTIPGGGGSGGTVFTMAPDGTGFNVLHAFTGGTEGANPIASLIQATDGNFYGTTKSGGGNNNEGTVFTMAPDGTGFSVLHAFTGGTDGVSPYASLIQATDGNFYGTTYGGGVITGTGFGVVFELIVAPTITTQPQSQTIAAGQTASLSVVASGSGLSYQWYQGTTGTTTNRIAGATANSYTTPALTSATSYWVRVSNTYGTADSTTATISIALLITTPSLPDGIVGQLYSAQLAAAYGTTPYTWSLSAMSTLPAGLTLSASGIIGGTPTDAGTFPITVQVNDASSPSQSDTHTFTLSIFAPITRIISLSGNLAFGDIHVGSTATSMLTISNKGTATLTVSGISYTTAGFSGNWAGTISAGASQGVTVTFAPVAATSYAGSLIVTADQTSGTPSIAVSGRTRTLIWRAATGPDVGKDLVWLMNGPTIATSAFAPTISDVHWQIKGMGDFDGDATRDVIWRNNQTGENMAWLMCGTTVRVSAPLPMIADPNWEIQGVGDFDGDGKADVIWRNKVTGQNGAWLMNGTMVARSALLPTIVDPHWEIKGVGDFNGDGKADVIWRNNVTGLNLVWLMNGLTVVNATFLPRIVDTNWDIQGIGDLDGDGKADIVWRNKVTGENGAWLMNGTTVAQSGLLPTITGTYWEIVAVGDLNGDGKADLVWRNKYTGQNDAWLMNGFAIQSSTLLPTMDVNWQLAGR